MRSLRPPLPSFRPAGQQLGVEGVQGGGREPLERRVAEPGHDVGLDVLAVHGEGVAPQPDRHSRQPAVDQEAADGDRGRLDIVASVDLSQQLDPGPLGVPFGAVAAVPGPPPLSGGGVAAEVEHDGIAAAALDDRAPHGRRR